MPPDAPTQARKPRTGGRKVRTGCITCKIRHVKCDEQKPACLKCSSTGRVCDGYVPKETTLPRTNREPSATESPGSSDATQTLGIQPDLDNIPVGPERDRQILQLFGIQTGDESAQGERLMQDGSQFELGKQIEAIASGALSIPWNPSADFAGTHQERRGMHLFQFETAPAILQARYIPRGRIGSNGDESQWVGNVPDPYLDLRGNDQERQSFHSFRYQTVQALVQGLSMDQVITLVLQISHSNDAVWHGAIALGSMTERFRLHSTITKDNELANARHNFAFLHYHKAIRQLREQMSSATQPKVEEILLTCFLFVTFEFLQGDDQAVLMHLQSGLDILRRQHLNLTDASIKWFVRLFDMLTRQTILWLGLEAHPSHFHPPIPHPEHDQPPVDCFSTLDEAEKSLNNQIFQMHEIRRVAVYHSSESPRGIPPALIEERKQRISDLERWPPAVRLLMKNNEDHSSFDDWNWATVLHINYNITYMMLTASIQTDENAVYSLFDSAFGEIVSLAKSLLQPVNVMVNSNLPRIAQRDPSVADPLAIFSFNMGTIQPLYFTALRCRQKLIQQEALELLLTSPWREGAWDSAAMAKIAIRRLSKGPSLKPTPQTLLQPHE